MGCTVREKHIRTNRRTRSVKPESDQPTSANKDGNVDKPANAKTGVKPKSYQMGLHALSQCPVSGPSSAFDDNGWGYCTEEQLEDILLKNLEYLYNDAVNKLVALGYNEEVALRAILRNGHCYGGMDVLTNILHNSLAYLNSGSTPGSDEEDEPEPSFADLRQLEEYSLAGMVCLLQQVKPHLSKGDAMWCLLMSDLHVGRASMIEIPVVPSPSGSTSGCEGALTGSVGDGPHSTGPVGVAPALCRFHGGWGFGNGGTSKFPANRMGGILSYASEMALQREIECPRRFNLSPSMRSLLKRNVAMFAAGFRANAKQFHSQSQACPSSLSGGIASGLPPPAGEETQHSNSLDVVNSVMSKFRDLNLDESTEHMALDQKDEMILSLVHQIKDLEKQVKERKEWAQQKAMQAARKLSHDLAELKMLRMERDEIQGLKKGTQTLEETTMKRLTDMEGALRMASSQVDRANAFVRKLETENAEIKAEMEASKLSASESVTTCLEVAKREKKCLKKLLAWEKQKAKVQEEIAAEKRRIMELELELAQVEVDTKAAEAKWRQEQKAKELALEQVEEERHLKEASEANNKRKLESLRLKIEIDFQRHKDDLQRLEQEYSRLKESSQSEDENQMNDSWTETVKPPKGGETIARLLHELDQTQEEKSTCCDCECMICMKDEVSVVFLPCAHQVICASCNEGYGNRRNKAVCPYCRVPIEQRIRVYGASS
ncbi:RING/U-box superfamily protein [Striga hermonthica]|uniref:RING/U-box superfamily protein n=1 Tax=Striga hermonthica TaxID=68872 RepID=A0A9N7MZI2_STRHE|nr:RING/U-box superfamily protein [Striga hermonthica]